jgi:putative protease
MSGLDLLSPAGNWDCARAAVENGANAIYFGLGRFNARLRATNFTEADLPELMAYLHRHGVRGYVTFNTLIFTDELADAERSLRAIIRAGADAIIVQDIGVARLIRRLSPDFPIHASTQMTVTSAAGVAFAQKLGASLVVLARECSIAEIEKIHASSPTAVPLEVFVHGALCVAYSGQCLTSEALGGRSANRGECAQACRMTYDLIADGEKVELGDRRYLLSPQDLSGLEVLPELARAGVASLKIEGRLKTPEYVANVTRVYRRAIDQLAARASASPAQASAAAGQITRETRYDLEMSFSRGLSTGWLGGIDNQKLVHARFGTKRGVFLGEIARVAPPLVWMRALAPVKAGDGVVFDAGRPDEGEEGGRIFTLKTRNGETALSFDPERVNFDRVRAGQRVWKTSDPALEKKIRATFASDQTRRREPVRFTAHGHADAPLTLEIRDAHGHEARLDSAVPLQPATNQPLTKESLRAQLDRLGGTPLALADLDFRVEGDVILPVSETNRLRRELAARLDELRAAPLRWTMLEAAEGESIRLTTSPPPTTTAPVKEPELIPVVRTMAQLEAAAGAGALTIYAEFEDPKRYRDAVKFVRALAPREGRAVEIWVLPPRIFKTGEEWILKQVRSCDADGYLARNYDHLNFFKHDRRRGDFSLNVANPLTAEYFIVECGLERLTASYDLNIRQLDALLRGAPPAWFEITIHQHMPLFHMEHCVFCAFLTKGKDYRDCGRPCDTREVRLRDRVGALHTLKADAGCRNTLYNARAQTGAEYAQHLVSLGASAFRIEFLHESADEVARTLASYRNLLRGEITGPELWRELKATNQLGVTRGTLG